MGSLPDVAAGCPTLCDLVPAPLVPSLSRLALAPLPPLPCLAVCPFVQPDGVVG